jgi:hypothetical protein
MSSAELVLVPAVVTGLVMVAARLVLVLVAGLVAARLVLVPALAVVTGLVLVAARLVLVLAARLVVAVVLVNGVAGLVFVFVNGRVGVGNGIWPHFCFQPGWCWW